MKTSKPDYFALMQFAKYVAIAKHPNCKYVAYKNLYACDTQIYQAEWLPIASFDSLAVPVCIVLYIIQNLLAPCSIAKYHHVIWCSTAMYHHVIWCMKVQQ